MTGRVPWLTWRGVARTAVLTVVLSVCGLTVPDSAVQPTDVALVRVTQASGVANNPDVIWILAVGSDARPGQSMLRSRGDALQLVGMNTHTGAATAIGVPRDSWVSIPGYGKEKINAAYAEGGLALSIRTVRNVTGVDVNHVAQVDFDGFKTVVDELGGIEIDNPAYVESGSCDDCDFDGRHWAFKRGKQTLSGRDALAYARIRKVSGATIRLNELEGTDLGRARRQQRVVDAIVQQVASIDSLKHPNGVPKAVVQPLLTDISASQMLAFGFGKWWSKPDNSLRCRLGGDKGYDDIGGEVVIPGDENRAVVRMFLGKQAPVPPENALAPGCVRLSD